jgi:hypothetical protein
MRREMAEFAPAIIHNVIGIIQGKDLGSTIPAVLATKSLIYVVETCIPLDSSISAKRYGIPGWSKPSLFLAGSHHISTMPPKACVSQKKPASPASSASSWYPLAVTFGGVKGRRAPFR